MMQLQIFLLAFLLAAIHGVLGTPYLPQTSPVPYSCPSIDNAGNELVGEGFFHGFPYCKYDLPQGYCVYTRAYGSLAVGQGHCPDSLNSTAADRKKRNGLPVAAPRTGATDTPPDSFKLKKRSNPNELV